MNRLHSNSRLLLLPVFISLTSAIYPARPYTIAGTIKNGTTDKNIQNAYIYIISGEEEALTNNKGAFTISTWQELPVTLIIERPTYKQKKIRITNVSEHQVIKLEPKQP